MSYKTILIHVTNERRAGPLLDFGTVLAERFGAHVICLYVFPAFRLTPPVSMPFGAALAGTLRGKLCEEERRIKFIFDTVTKRRSVVSEWRSITTERRPVADVVMDHARAADLIIASQADPDWGFSDILDCPDRLAIESGRPALVMPCAGRFPGLPGTAIVAWNGGREAARAVFDALPLLCLAETVEILTIEEQPKAEASLPGSDIAAALARHGATVKVTNLTAGQGSAAHAIRARAADHKSAVLVMGAYGHSRLSEFVFGGVTRQMLKETPIPVLFSH